jgi:outer membrane receptor protein involved in Fe transport
MGGTRTNSLRLILAGSAGFASLLGAHAAAAADTAPSATAVEEVIVTAEKRAVNIQLAPVSISAVKGEKMQDLGLKSLADYSQYVPGLVIGNGGTPGETSITLRGIAPVSAGAVVGTYIDDTPLGSSNGWARATTFALDLMPYELDRFEVLRGPQGTIYGAGAMGGLVKYVLKQADPNAFSGEVGGEINTTSGSSGLGSAERAAVNIPIVHDKLGLRLSVFNQDYQGYTDNPALGLKNADDGYQRGGRVAVTFRPTDKLRINLNGLFTRTRFDDGAFVRLGNVTSTVEDGVTLYHGQPVGGDFNRANSFTAPFSKDIDYFSSSINWDLGPVTAVSATSYSHTVTYQRQDATDAYGVYTQLFGMPAGVGKFDLDLDLKKWTQEFRLQSPSGGRFEWLAGAFYTHEDSANHQVASVLDANYQPITGPFAAFFNPYFALAEVPTTYEEYAFFGDLTWNLTPKFDVTGGLRYAHNKQTFHQITDGLILGGFTDAPGASSEGVTTWSANARYRFSDEVMGYARAATGYRPGGPNVALPGVPPTVGSDTLTNYEAGIKSTFWDGRALLNFTVFDIEWKNIQLDVSNITCGCSYGANGGDAYSRGFELEGSLVPVEGLRIGYNAAYTKAVLTSLVSTAVIVPPPYLLGYQLPGVPKFSGGATIDYEWAAAGDWRASVGAGLRYVGKEYANPPSAQGLPTSLLNTQDPAYTTVDLRAGLSNGRYRVNLFVRNLADKRAYISQTPIQNGLTGDVAGILAVPVQPRVIGISLDASF